MESFYYLFSDGESDFVYHYQNLDHVDVYENGKYLYTRECDEREIISAWETVNNL